MYLRFVFFDTTINYFEAIWNNFREFSEFGIQRISNKLIFKQTIHTGYQHILR